PPGRLAGVLEPRGRRAPPLFILWRTSGNGARRLRPDVLGGVAACELDERPAALRRGGNLTGRRACQLGGIWAHRRGATAPGPASSPGRQTLARGRVEGAAARGHGGPGRACVSWLARGRGGDRGRGRPPGPRWGDASRAAAGAGDRGAERAERPRRRA